MVKIISLGYSVPPNSYTQEEVFTALDYPKPFYKIFRDSGIEKRHFWLSPERIKGLTWQEACEEYQKGAIKLATEAIRNCLDGRDPRHIGLLALASCTGISPGPTIGHYLVPELGLREDIYITNILSQGCEGAFPSLRRAYDFTKVTGRYGLALVCELCSLTFFPENKKPDPENDYELARGNAIFGDGCACALIGNDRDWRHPKIIDFEVYTNPNYINDLGFIWRDGRLRLKLSKRVPEIAAELAIEVIYRILKKHWLTVDEINHWIIHAAGNKVLDNIKDRLKLTEEKIKLSRQALRLYGNQSSASVGVIGKLLMESGRISRRDYALMVTIGPGLSSGVTLFHFQ